KYEIETLHVKETRANSISCSITEITGGSSHNVTPQTCRITIDIRIPTNNTCANVLKLIDGVINKVAIKE
ncbi:MAG: peptidase dimerization domain-containing protein, partial [Nitrososphaera sp.]|nr:peptidase dimerization domain-containing protein [Nitrososphaera sp.]